MSFISVEIDRRRLRRITDMFSLRKRQAVRRAALQANVRAGVMLLGAIQEGIQREGLIRTGNYLNSWELIASPDGGTVTVRTTHPAARRLEYGFSGTDSMGRVYNQAPRPHVRPAMASVKGRAFAGTQAAIRKELST